MNERTKFLVVDDSADQRWLFKETNAEMFDCPSPISESETLESCLREVPYRGILLDGELGLNLGGVSDGDTIARRIRDGKYGEVNKETLIYCISSVPSFFAKGTGAIWLPYPELEVMERIVSELLSR